MPFTVSVTADTLEDCIVQLIQTYKNVLAASAPIEGNAAQIDPPLPPVKPTAEQAAAVDETAEFKPAPTPAPAPASAPAPAVDAEALRTEIRTVLTPLMKGDKAAAARALVKAYGDGVSAVPVDKLAELLAKAKELA